MTAREFLIRWFQTDENARDEKLMEMILDVSEGLNINPIVNIMNGFVENHKLNVDFPTNWEIDTDTLSVQIGPNLYTIEITDHNQYKLKYWAGKQVTEIEFRPTDTVFESIQSAKQHFTLITDHEKLTQSEAVNLALTYKENKENSCN